MFKCEEYNHALRLHPLKYEFLHDVFTFVQVYLMLLRLTLLLSQNRLHLICTYVALFRKGETIWH